MAGVSSLTGAGLKFSIFMSVFGFVAILIFLSPLFTLSVATATPADVASAQAAQEYIPYILIGGLLTWFLLQWRR